MSGKKIFITAVFGLLCFAVAEAQTGRRQVHDTIPFEVVYDKFIFQATIDGKPLRLILDTGGINALVADSAEYFGFTAISTQRIADANDAVMLTQMGSVQNFRIGRYMNWGTGRMTLIPNHQFLRDLGVAGTVGGEFFAQVCLTIDKRNRHFIISSPFRPSGISRSDGTPMEMGSTFHSIVPVSFGGEKINVLFDTGKSGFLNMAAADFERLNRAGSAEKEYIGSGILFVGATGFENAISDEIIIARVPEITLPGGKQLLNTGTTVSQTTTTIFGQQLLDFGVMMLDYPRGLFYFFPYEEYRNVATDVAEMTRAWNTRILPVHDSFRVVATIGEVDTEIGDRVWSINGTPLTLDNFSEMFVLELLRKAENGMAEIMIGEYENQLRKVTIKRI